MSDDHIPGLVAKGIAEAIILQAEKDATDPMAPAHVRADASDFLAGQNRYVPIAKVAGLNPQPPMTKR